MNLRNYKITYQLYNFFNRSRLKHNIPLYGKYGLNKKYYSSLSSEDFKSMTSPKNIYDLNDSSVEMPKDEYFKSLDNDEQLALSSWSQNGYAVLKSFFSPSEVDACNAEVDKLIESSKVKFKYLNKIMFAFRHSDVIRGMGTDDKLLGILKMILGKEVDLFQSINFLEGSQQRSHSDTIHMSTFPYGNLIAVWVALEDINAESGPLHYYPGSHKLPYVMNRDYGNLSTKYKLGTRTYTDYEDHIEQMIVERNLEKKKFIARKGDILIWHANLLHGGEQVINENSSRKSMVFHYYSRDSICFHEVTERPALKRILK